MKFFNEEPHLNCSCTEACNKTIYEADLSYALFSPLPNGSNSPTQFKAYYAANINRQSSGNVRWKDYLRYAKNNIAHMETD